MKKGSVNMNQFINISRQFYHYMQNVDVFGLAAQLAYFFLLSLFPFLLFLVTLLGYLPIDERELLTFIYMYYLNEIMDFILVNILNHICSSHVSLFLIFIFVI